MLNGLEKIKIFNEITTEDIKNYVMPYKVYTAVMSQINDTAPTAVILENTLSGIPTWTYDSVGTYICDLPDEIEPNKLFVVYNNGGWINGAASGNTSHYQSASNQITFYTYIHDSPSNNVWAGSLPQNIEIRIYA